MKWMRTKSSSLLTRVFPVSWFKKKRRNHEVTTNNNSALSPVPSAYRFYSMDEDDAFWRISFSDDIIPPRRSTGEINPLRRHQNPIFKLQAEEQEEVSSRNFSEMVSDIKRMRERRGKEKGNDEIELKKIKVKPRAKESKHRAAKAYSPRTECKIRAIEEMKMRAKRKEAKSAYERFAVVKSSVDPERDFKESMVEMIREKGLGHPHDLEQLLACYLTLNCHHFHHIIINVFQQDCDLHSNPCYGTNTVGDPNPWKPLVEHIS